MCKDHDLALKVVSEFIDTHKRFTYKEIVDYVIEKAGTTWLSRDYHIRDYLERMCYHGILRRVSPTFSEFERVED